MTRDDTAPPQPDRPLTLDPEQTRYAGRPPYAVVDIGSNSVRLVVYDRLGRAPFPRFNEKSLCRLGAGLEQSGELSAESCRRTVEAMRRFRAIADAMGVPRIDVIATEAIRRASNGDQLVAAIAQQAGFTVRVLSGAEEARYAALGVIAGFYRPKGLVGDMGGGSLEVAEVDDDTVGTQSVSLPLGALPVQALMAKAGSDAKRQLDALLKERLAPAAPGSVFYAVGGGWRAFAKVHMATVAAPVRVAHGYTLETAEARTFARTLWGASEAKLATLPGVPARRAQTLAPAALVLDRLLRRLAPQRVVFSALGLREGWLYAQLPAEEQYLDPLIEGAQAFGIPSARAPAIAPALVRWTDTLFPDETPQDRRLRVAACAVSDIGWRDHASVQASESFRRLVQFPLIGLDHTERVFLAAAVHARYAGRGNDPTLAPAIDLLPARARSRAQILGRVLLLGYRISGGVPAILASARLRIEPDAVRLEISKIARVPDSEVVADRLGLVASAVGVRRTEVVEVA